MGTTSLPTNERHGLKRLAITWLLVLALLFGLATTIAGTIQGTGYFTTSSATFSTPARALVTDEIAVGATSGMPADPSSDLGELARIRIQAQPTNSGKALFVGIGPKQQVDAYLRDTSYDRMASYTTSPLRVRYDRTDGTSQPASPQAQPFWVAKAQSKQQLSLEWDKQPGTWALVAMNSDGSPQVAAKANIGFRFAFLLPIGIPLLLLAALGLAWQMVTRQKKS